MEKQWVTYSIGIVTKISDSVFDETRLLYFFLLLLTEKVELGDAMKKTKMTERSHGYSRRLEESDADKESIQ